MVELNEITNGLQTKLSAEQEQDMLLLAERYPYCSSFQMMYAKCLEAKDTTKFEEKLPLLSLYAPSRSFMYRYITEEWALEQTEEEIIQEESPLKFAKKISLGGLVEMQQSTPKQEQPPIDNEKQEPETEFFSEALAKIYIKQHKYERAIKIFEKLSLKYPEKSVYFADQIRFLRIIVENNK